MSHLKYYNTATLSWELAIVGTTGAASISTATSTQLGGVKIGSNINISPTGTISVTTGAGINRVIDIPDVNSTELADGSILIYNAALNRWDLTNSLQSASTASADGGEF